MLDHALPRCRRSVTRPLWSCRAPAARHIARGPKAQDRALGPVPLSVF
ncbi:hypothetical protein DA2_2699 [Desulfovibrio sp. A2]|nr:hypothetical protein DA2_2699 [Desulfovibrio sp. A2]